LLKFFSYSHFAFRNPGICLLFLLLRSFFFVTLGNLFSNLAQPNVLSPSKPLQQVAITTAQFALPVALQAEVPLRSHSEPAGPSPSELQPGQDQKESGKSQTDEAVAELARLKLQTAQLMASVSKKDARIRDADADMERVLSKLSQESQKRMELQEQNNSLAQVVKDKDSAVKRLSAKLAEASQNAADAVKLKAVTEQLAATHAQMDSLEEELAESKEQLFLAETARQDSRRIITANEDIIFGQKKQIARANDEVEDFKKQLADLRAEMTRSSERHEAKFTRAQAESEQAANEYQSKLRDSEARILVAEEATRSKVHLLYHSSDY
jgi:chromosome segregation ATPase